MQQNPGYSSTSTMPISISSLIPRRKYCALSRCTTLMFVLDLRSGHWSHASSASIEYRRSGHQPEQKAEYEYDKTVNIHLVLVLHWSNTSPTKSLASRKASISSEDCCRSWTAYGFYARTPMTLVESLGSGDYGPWLRQSTTCHFVGSDTITSFAHNNLP